MWRSASSGLLCAGIVVLSAAALSTAANSPSDLATSIVSAMQAQRSVHVVDRFDNGETNVTLVTDAGTDGGVQRVAYRKGNRTGHVTVVLSGKAAYVRGDAFALVNYMGYAPARTAKYANTWILIPDTDGDYSAVAAGLTVASMSDEIEPFGPFKSLPRTRINGKQVVGVGGTVNYEPASLYALAASPHLPVKETRVRGTARTIATLANWNEPIRVSPPANAIPISKTGLE